MSPVGLISLKSDIVILKHVFYYLFFMFEYSKRYPLYLTFHNSQIKQVGFFFTNSIPISHFPSGCSKNKSTVSYNKVIQGDIWIQQCYTL